MKRLQPNRDALERLPLRISHPPTDIFLEDDDSATLVFDTHVLQYATLVEGLGALGLRREHFIEVPLASAGRRGDRRS